MVMPAALFDDGATPTDVPAKEDAPENASTDAPEKRARRMIEVKDCMIGADFCKETQVMSRDCWRKKFFDAEAADG